MRTWKLVIHKRGMSMMKKLRGNIIICIILMVAIGTVLIWYKNNKELKNNESYNDGIEQLDLDSIYLKNSGVQIDFSEVIVGKEKESRKLIVYEQEATVATQLTDSLIKKLDIDWMKKTQKVSYTGKGYFVVDLDRLTGEDVVVDENKKTVTIKIGHAYLQTIEINPDDIIVDEVKESLLAKGDIELTVADYHVIEKELANRLETKFNSADNGQKADDIALKMVKNVYEPIVKAIDSGYNVCVEFR